MVQRAYLPTLMARADVRLVGIADAGSGRAAALARTHGIAHATSDWRDLVGTADAVIVAADLPSRAEMIISSVEGGSHVLAEKPMAATAAEAFRSLDVAKRLGRGLSVNFNYRHLPPCAALKAHAASLGSLGSIDVRMLRHSGVPPSPWLSDPTRIARGVSFDLGTHAVDLILWLADAVHAEVTGGTLIPSASGGLDHLAEVSLRLNKGTGRAEVAWEYDGPDVFEITVAAEKGLVRLSRADENLHLFAKIDGSPPVEQSWSLLESFAFAQDRVLDAFITSCRAQRSDHTIAEQAAIGLALIESAAACGPDSLSDTNHSLPGDSSDVPSDRFQQLAS